MEEIAAAWLSLLPYAEDDLRSWLGERGAGLLLERGVDLREIAKPEHAPAVAEVLAEVLGHPHDVIEGEPLA